MNDTTLYFAYGSNLLKSRIRLNNPSAMFKDIGKLENYRLDFVGLSNGWNGSPATIVPEQNGHVWGAIWEINSDDIKNLDVQEGLHDGLYRVFTVDVTNPDGKVYTCRVYQHTKTSTENLTELPELPDNKSPSLTYLKTIVKGATDIGLPDEYISNLKKTKHNGYVDKEHPIWKEICDIRLD